MAWINWLLKPKYMLIHILFWNFLCCLKIRCYNIYIYIWETRPYAWKQNIFFNKLFFLRKPGILIPNLYLYSIKIQTGIDQNTVTKLWKITYFLKVFFLEFKFFLLDWTRPKKGLGRNWPKIKQAYFLQGWTQSSHLGWADIPARNEHGLVTVHLHSNQLIN